MTGKQPLRADHVGSLLRTQAIKDARAKHAASEITDKELTEIENTEIEKITGTAGTDPAVPFS